MGVRVPPGAQTRSPGPSAGASARSTPRLIVVCGLSGAGKTTIATALSRQLNVVCLHKDSIKTAIFDRVGLLTSKSFSVLEALVEEQLANGVDLIVEATFQFPDSADVLRRWQRTYDLDLVCVICTAGVAERERRITARPRHEAHAEADARQRSAVDAEADFSTLPGRHILVGTNGTPAAAVADALRELAHVESP